MVCMAVVRSLRLLSGQPRPHIDQFEGGRRLILSRHAVVILVTLEARSPIPSTSAGGRKFLCAVQLQSQGNSDDNEPRDHMVGITRAPGRLERPTTVAAGGWNADLLTPGELRVRLYGEWLLSGGSRSAAEISQRLSSVPRPSQISFDAGELEAWDNVLINFLTKLEVAAGERGIAVDHSGLPGGVQRLVALARAVPERQGARHTQQRPDLLTRVGGSSLSFLAMAADLIVFLGEALIGIGRMLLGRARFRRSDLMIAIEDCGPNALPIVALISFLVGLILAFVGAKQLEQFGAAIFVANLVGIAMAREMGAMMTAILMSGRTGAAFAANLGTMQVSDEVSALQTLGIPPMEFLVLPRIVAVGINDWTVGLVKAL